MDLQRWVCQHGVKGDKGHNITYSGCQVLMDVSVCTRKNWVIKNELHLCTCTVNIIGTHNHSTAGVHVPAPCFEVLSTARERQLPAVDGSVGQTDWGKSTATTIT